MAVSTEEQQSCYYGLSLLAIVMDGANPPLSDLLSGALAAGIQDSLQNGLTWEEISTALERDAEETRLLYEAIYG